MKVEDIVVDEGFIDWVLQKNTAKSSEWQLNLPKLNIEKVDLEQAIEIVKLLSIAEQRPSLQEIEIEKARLFSTIQQRQKSKYRTMFSYAAAAIVFLCVSGFSYFSLFYNQATNLQTTFGETKNFVLPDGSNIMLNSNSQIKYSKNKESNKREVWINGEAFFKVAKKENKEPFIVHTNQFDVVVTGTEFNINNRQNLSTVLLTEGSITINNKNGSITKLLPGQYYYFGENEAKGKPISIVTNRVDVVTAWMYQKLVFENTSLIEIASIIKETYNVDVEFNANVNSKKTVSGILPNNNIDILLQSLSAATNYKFTLKNSTISVALP